MRDSWYQRKYLLHLYVIDQRQKFFLFVIGQLLIRLHVAFNFRVLYLLPKRVVNITADNLLALYV